MESKTALNIISAISLIGVLFSGYLTFSELIAKSCSITGCQLILGLPTCLYGLIMYTIVFVVSLLGRK